MIANVNWFATPAPLAVMIFPSISTGSPVYSAPINSSEKPSAQVAFALEMPQMS